MHHALLEEIRNINTMLIDTELTLNEEDADWTAVAGESILVKCTYKAIAPSTYFTSSQLVRLVNFFILFLVLLCLLVMTKVKYLSQKFATLVN